VNHGEKALAICFPSSERSTDPRSGQLRRLGLNEIPIIYADKLSEGKAEAKAGNTGYASALTTLEKDFFSPEEGGAVRAAQFHPGNAETATASDKMSCGRENSSRECSVKAFRCSRGTVIFRLCRQMERS
jgi:hypothetical protein